MNHLKKLYNILSFILSIGLIYAFFYFLKFMPVPLLDTIKIIFVGVISFFIILPLLMFADSPSAQVWAQSIVKNFFFFIKILIWWIIILWISRVFAKPYYYSIRIGCMIFIWIYFIVILYSRNIPKFDKKK